MSTTPPNQPPTSSQDYPLRREAEEEAERILNSPNVMKELTPHLDNIIAGEDSNKKLAFVLALSGKCKDPKLKQIVLTKGEPGAGKSQLMQVTNAFKTRSVGRFSRHALDYANLQEDEILRLKELGTMDQEDQGTSTLKFLSSDDAGYTVETTERDEQGKFTTGQYKVPPITLFSSTTRISLDPQFERRAWILNTDESAEQTERVRKWKAKNEEEKNLVDLSISKATSFKHSTMVLEVVVQKIEPLHVILPFPDNITKVLKSTHLRVRGDYDKVIALVKLYTLLEQRHLPIIEINNKKVIVVTPNLAIEALRLAERPFVTMTTQLDERARRIIDILKEEDLDSKGSSIDNETRGSIATKLHRSDRWVYDQLREWCKAGYMTVAKDTSQRGSPVSFKLLYSLKHFEEKNAVSFEDLDSSIKLGLDMQKEATEWLDHIVEKLAVPDKHMLETVRQSMIYTAEQRTPSTGQNFHQSQNRQESGSSAETKSNLVFESQNTGNRNRFLSGTLIGGLNLFFFENNRPSRHPHRCALCNESCDGHLIAYDNTNARTLRVCENCYRLGLENQNHRGHRR